MANLILGTALLAQGIAAAKNMQNTVSLPLYLAYGDGTSQVMMRIQMGEPAGEALPIVADTGSANFWIFGPNATLNYGSQYLSYPGPCNETADPFYDYPASTAATAPQPFGPVAYSYGGNSKSIQSHSTVNDTLVTSFPSGTSRTPNVRVAVSEFARYRQSDDGSCARLLHETGILGLAPYASGQDGPSFREDLLDTGAVNNRILSMWFEANEGGIEAPLNGTALIGAVDEAKFEGELVEVALVGKRGGTGYFVNTPTIAVNGAELVLDTGVTDCLLDSGGIFETLPYADQDAFLNATGLVLLEGFVAYPSACEDIPKEKMVEYVFAGKTGGEKVSVKVPLRNYARGAGDGFGKGGVCGLQIMQGSSGCTLAAPFLTGAFVSADDGEGTFRVAQAGLKGSYEES